MPDNRLERWVFASHGLGGIEPFMTLTLQGLGRLDCQLIPEDARFLSLTPESQATIDESARLTDRFTLSYLWVLGAYEIVRSLDQRCRADTAPLGGELNRRVNGFKHKIERLRIPLAKFEPARRSATDSPIAYPAISRELGVAWQLAPDTFVSRRELSDELLSLVEDIRSNVQQDA